MTIRTTVGVGGFWQRLARPAAAAGCLALGAAAANADNIKWRGVDPAAHAQPIMTAAAAAQKLGALVNGKVRQHVVVQFDRAITAETRAKLKQAGVTLLRSLGEHAYFATVESARLNVPGVAAVNELQMAQEVHIDFKLHPMLRDKTPPPWSIVGETLVEGALSAEPIVGAYITFHKDVDLADGEALVQASGGIVRDQIVTVNGLVIELPLSQVELLAGNDIVQWIEPPLPKFSEMNNSNRAATQVDLLQSTPYNLDGSGVTVMVYDSANGLVEHADFGGRLDAVDNEGVSNHSTHVAGTIGGNGSESGGLYRGMAPNTTLKSYGFDSDGSGIFLYSNPGDTETDYGDAINNEGAVLANNSIGTNTATNGFPCEITGDYGVMAELIDGIVRGSLGEPIRIVWANGNERQTTRCGDLYYTTAPPATAKNHLTIGALNSDDNSVTDFTSWGPTDDGRMKPDISAPGCQIGDDGGVTSAGSSGGYSSLCGTSMAAPTVTGIAALLLQDFRQVFPGRPDFLPSTMKALFVQNAMDIENPGPDHMTGYGLVQAKETIDFMRTDNFRELSVSQGQIVQIPVVVPGVFTPQLKVTIAWDDAPASPNISPSIVNDLDLRVVSPSGAVTHLPWSLSLLDPGMPAVQITENRRDNIEQVVIADPEGGTWTIEVEGFDVPEGPQIFSVASSAAMIGTSINLPNGVPLLLDPGVATPITVAVTPTGEELVEDSVKMFYRIDGGSFTELPLSLINGNDWQAMLPAVLCDQQIDFYFQAEGSMTGVSTNPFGAPTFFFSASPGIETLVFADDSEAELGWVFDNSPSLTDGQWDRGFPVGGDRGDPAFDADDSGQCYLTDNEDGNSDVDNGSTTLVSPVLDASLGEMTLSYYRWFSNTEGDNPNQDIMVIEVTDDGGASWLPLETVGPAGAEADGGWVLKQWLLADIPDLEATSTFQIRFVVSDTDPQSVVEAAVDGVQLLRFECENPINNCAEDVSPDGNIDVFDTLAVLETWGACNQACPPMCATDTNGDCAVDVFDLLNILDAWGPCPE